MEERWHRAGSWTRTLTRCRSDDDDVDARSHRRRPAGVPPLPLPWQGSPAARPPAIAASSSSLHIISLDERNQKNPKTQYWRIQANQVRSRLRTLLDSRTEGETTTKQTTGKEKETGKPETDKTTTTTPPKPRPDDAQLSCTNADALQGGESDR